jgi:hypothetical protein
MYAPFSEWTPDQAVLGQTGASVALNVVPHEARSYAPFSGLTTITDALSARCQGAYAVRQSSGVVRIFAGDATKLYQIIGAAWEDVSGATYTTDAQAIWAFAAFGDRVLATNYSDAIQSYLMGTSTDFADLSVDAPKARYIWTVKDFVMVGDTVDGTDGQRQNRVWWSAIADPTSWPTPGSAAAEAVQSDFNDLPYGGQVVGGVGGFNGCDGAIFCRDAIYRIAYSGTGTVFDFLDAERGRGCAVPGSIIEFGDGVFFIAEDGIKVFNGANSISIGDGKVDHWFWNNVNQDHLSRINAGYDARNKLIYLAFPSTESTGTPDMMLVWNIRLNRFSVAEENVEYLLRAYSLGYTLEELDAFGTMETLPYSLDSTNWMGGRPGPAGFGDDHKLGFFSGSTKAATVETGEVHDTSGRRAFVSRARPICDLSAGTLSTQIGYRDSQGGTVSYTTATTQGLDGTCPHRIDARYMRARVSVSAGATWTHLQGVEIDARQTGRR